MSVPTAPPGTRIQFPAWNNLYLMRDFVHNVRGLKARCAGSTLKLARLDRNTWRSGNAPCSNLEVRYAVRANEESPFSSALNAQHAFLNFALLLFYLPDERARALHVKLLLPEGWKLASLLDGHNGEFTAPNYDVLADSPIEAGHFDDFDFEQGGATFHVVVHDESSGYSSARLLDALQKITATETGLMQDVPFSRYTFILHFARHDASGGMEHASGAAVSVPAAGLDTHWGFLEDTLAHEFFHLWNVKRIRPQGLEPVDYTRGNDTRDLWFSEGVTSAYAELALARAGLISRDLFYQRISEEIGRLEGRPARHTQSVAESGSDAWREGNRKYNRPEHSISYYNKGELLGFLLDLGIRHAARNRRSLDDVMRRLNEDFARHGRFFTEADLQSLVAEIAPSFTGRDAFFRDYVSGTRDLDYTTYLGFAGLRLVTAPGGPRHRTAYRVEEIPDATLEQLRVRDGWLKGMTDAE